MIQFDSLPKYKIENIIPLTVYKLMSLKKCIAWPCTTCGGKELEEETLNQLNNFIKNVSLKTGTKTLQSIFIEAMCKMDMSLMISLNEETRTSNAPFSGNQLPYWSVYLRNISKNDITNKSERLTFSFDYKEIYTYWINYRINEIDLIDFMIFYNQFVPTNLKDKLYEEGKKLSKSNNHKSLSETLEYKKKDF